MNNLPTRRRALWLTVLCAPWIALACQGSSFSSGLTQPAGSSEGGTKSTGDGSADFVVGDDVDESGDGGLIAFDSGPTTPKCSQATAFGAPTRISGLPEGAIGVRFLPDEKTVFFSVDKQSPSKIYRATRASKFDAFTTPTQISLSVTPGDIRPGSEAPSFTGATVTNDELTIFVASDYSYYYAQKDGGAYGMLRKVPNYAQDASVARLLTTPLLSEDGTSFYGSSIFFHFGNTFAAVVTGTTISAPTPIEFGFSGRNRSIVVTPDGLLAYFGSNRENEAGATFPGTPDYQVWTASRASRAEPFSNPLPVVELRTVGLVANDPTWISSDGCRLYFQSDRNGSFNTYVAERPIQL